MPKRFHTELERMRVVGAGGRVFGELEDVELDEVGWRATGLVVKVSSEAVTDLGLEKPFWTRARLMIPIHHVSAATDVIVLRTSLDEFRQLIAVADSID